jgi:hypothetical protein
LVNICVHADCGGWWFFFQAAPRREGHHGMIVRREGEIICKTAEENFLGRGWCGISVCGVDRGSGMAC